MKVYHRGFNLYKQYPNSPPLVEDWIDWGIENLRHIEVNYSYNVLLVADELRLYGGNFEKQPEVHKFGQKIAGICSNDYHVLVLLENGNLCKVLKDNVREVTQIPKPIDSDEDEKMIKISMGSHVHLAQSSKGHFYALPDDKLDFESKDIVDIKAGREHCLLLHRNGDLYSFGGGSRGQLGHGTLDNELEPKLIEALAGVKIAAISSGGWHSCALSKDGDLYSWGWNSNYQLGLRSEGKCEPQFSAIATPTIVDFEMDVKKISCGAKHTLVLLENSQLFGCGWNKYKQLKNSEDENLEVMTPLRDFSNETVTELKCAPWSSLVLCE